MTKSQRFRPTLSVIAGVMAMFMGSLVKADDSKVPSMKVGIIKAASLASAWVAKERGIFAKNGLDVTLVDFRSGGEAIAANRGGYVDLFNSIPGTAMVASEHGFDLLAVSQNEVAKAQGPDSGAVEVRADSPYRSLKDLAGKKIAVGALHTQKTVALQVLFKRAGVDISELQLVEVPFSSQVDLLRSKQVDAIDTIDPFTTQVSASGLGRVIAWDYADSIPEQPLGAWFGQAKYIDKNADAIARFNKSMKESIEYMMSDPTRAREEVVAYSGLPSDIVKQMPMIGWDYTVRPDKWQAVIDMLVGSGELQSPHKAAEYFSTDMKSYIAK